MFERAELEPDGGYANGCDMTILVVDALRNTPPNPTAAQMQTYFSKLHDWPRNAIYDFRLWPKAKRKVGGAAGVLSSQRGSGQNGFESAGRAVRSSSGN